MLVAIMQPPFDPWLVWIDLNPFMRKSDCNLVSTVAIILSDVRVHTRVCKLLNLGLFPLAIETSDIQVDHLDVNIVFDNMPHFSDLRYFGGFLYLPCLVDFIFPLLDYINGLNLIDYES